MCGFFPHKVLSLIIGKSDIYRGPYSPIPSYAQGELLFTTNMLLVGEKSEYSCRSLFPKWYLRSFPNFTCRSIVSGRQLTFLL